MDNITKPDQSALISKVADLLLSGYSKTEIRTLLKFNAPLNILSNVDFDALIEDGKKYLEETVSTDSKQIVTIHIGLYEEIYKYYKSIGHTEGANKAMRAKERLMGMIGKNKVVINKKTDITIHRKIEYDLTRLTPAQKKRYQELYNKILIQPEPERISNTINL